MLFRSDRKSTRLNSSHTIISYALPIRSEEHTSELQSHDNLVCRLLLEKKNNTRRGWPPRPVPRPRRSRPRSRRATAGGRESRVEGSKASRAVSCGWKPAFVFLSLRAPTDIRFFPHPGALPD